MMRRLFVTALAVPALLLSACGSDEPEVVEPTTTVDAAPTTEGPADDAESTSAPAPTEDEMAGDDETATDDAAGTTEAPEAGGGDGEGQAAADRAKEWLVAFVNGEDTVCDFMLDLSGEGPMKDSEADREFCVTYIPAMAQDMFPSEVAGIVEAMEINGATVQGDTAVVGRENFSELFAEGFGEETITLKRVGGEWYVDLQESFQGGGSTTS